MTKAEKVVAGITYLMTLGKISLCAEHDVLYVNLDEVKVTSQNTDHMEALGWESSDADENGFQIDPT